MKTIHVPAREQVSAESQQIFDAIAKKMGKVPNLFAAIGYSSDALRSFLDFDEAFNHGSFSAKEREAVSLAVSQVNHCDYCVAAHSMVAGMKGFNERQILNFRKGIADDPKLKAALQLAIGISENKGHAPESLKTAFFDAGYNEKALIDLIGMVTVRTFTNYVYAMTKVPVDFPAAPSI